MKTTVWARHSFRAAHFWPGAPPHRAYLGIPHPHLFSVKVSIEVNEGADPLARSIEFHDLAAELAAQVEWITNVPTLTDGGETDLGGESCETLAAGIGRRIGRHLNVAIERITVEVDEDGVAGAIVKFTQEDPR